MKVIKESIYSDLYKPLKKKENKKKKANAPLSPLYKDLGNKQALDNFNNSVDYSKLSSGEGEPSGTVAEEYNDFDKMGTPVEKLEDVLGMSLSNTQVNYIYDGWRAFYNNPDTYKDTVAPDLILHAMDLAGVLEDEEEKDENN